MNHEVNIYVAKELTVLGLPPVALEYVKGALTYNNPEYLEFLKRPKNNVEISSIPKHLFYWKLFEEDNIIQVPTGFYFELTNYLNSLDIEYVTYRVTEDIPVQFPKHSIKLRQYQVRPINQTLKEFESNPSFILLSKAGSGKTVMALYIAQALGQKTIWLTDKKFLFTQAIDRIRDFLNIPEEEIGKIQGKEFSIGNIITVAMIPTLYRKDLSTIEKEFGTVIVDECVSIPAKTFYKVTTSFSSKYKLGLTAMAEREDGLTKAVYRVMGPPRIQPEPGGVVYPLVVQRPTGRKYHVDDELLKKYKFILDRQVYKDKIRNRMIVDDIAYYHKKFITVVLTRNVEHMELLRKELKDRYKIDSAIVNSKQKVTEKNSNKEAFESGEYHIIFATFNMLKKGYDYNKINRLIWAFPISSKEWIVQSVGRATREADGKRGALVVDYVDDNKMLSAQASIRERVYKEEGLHVITRKEKEYLTDADKSKVLYEDDQSR